MSSQAKKNRNSNQEGLGPSLHRSDLIPFTEHRRRLGHSSRRGQQMGGQKVRQKWMEHQQKWEQIRNSQSSIDPNSELTEIPYEIELWVQEKLNKKRCVYELGSEGVKLKHLVKATTTSRGPILMCD